MRAKDIMTTNLSTVTADSLIHEITQCLLTKHISGVPVTDADGRVLGIISEGDIIHRVAATSAGHRSWWARLFDGSENDAAEFVKTHAIHARDIMTREVTTVTEDTPAEEIVRILEKRRIKRVPVLRGERLVGIVSRSDLLRVVLASSPETGASMSASDRELRERIMANLEGQDWARVSQLNIVVSDGVAQLWGFVGSDTERNALRVAAETVPGIREVEDHLNLKPIPWDESRGHGFGGAGGIV
jgi:CBS domain-containing protein